jgi:hypothetical protein
MANRYDLALGKKVDPEEDKPKKSDSGIIQNMTDFGIVRVIKKPLGRIQNRDFNRTMVGLGRGEIARVDPNNPMSTDLDD